MSPGGTNPFSMDSPRYARARPRYPAALFQWLAEHSPARHTAWDCATGTGQAAAGLARHFTRVEATDISPEQLSSADPLPNVRYSVRPAEDSAFAEGSFDLVVVAQALHWFDYQRFWPEVSRVCREGALFCAWGYDWFTSTPEVDTQLVAPLRSVLAPFWAPQSGILWAGYPDHRIAFPYERLETPVFSIEERWSLQQLLDYLGTWSACKRALEDAAASVAVAELLERAALLAGASSVLPVTMRLKLVAGRVAAA